MCNYSFTFSSLGKNQMNHHPLRWLSAVLLVSLILVGCTTTSHPEQPTNLGQAMQQMKMESLLGQPGPIELQTIESADWSVDLSGLVNLNRPQAKAAGLTDRDEPIKVYLHLLRHPTRGLYMIDTGFSAQMVRDPNSLGVGKILQHALKFDRIRFHTGPGDVIRKNGGQLQGVFLTHSHLDHIGGMSEIPETTPIYLGPNETKERHWTHFFTHSAVDQILNGRPNLWSWNFLEAERSDLSVIDIFGDASVFAIAAPGHTKGSTVYLVRTSTGPVLLTGDTSHTRWGWENSVEPGGFTRDAQRNLESLLKLKALVARHPKIKVRFGHQL
jgi:N-acyl homoserine lactone hydrolase